MPALYAKGIALFAISYDSVAVLADFAAKHGITFPLLSDEGSQVIRRLGLINEGVLDDHAFYGIKANPRHVDLPYSGVFVLDRAGIISHKRFHESYRVRDTGAGLLEPGQAPARALRRVPRPEVREDRPDGRDHAEPLKATTESRHA